MENNQFILEQDVCAIYIRVSTEKQVEHGDSIEMQENLGKKHIQDINGILYKIYIEPAVSASKTKLKDRTVLLECLSDAKAGLFTKLIAYRRDRLSRKIEDSLAIRNMLQDANCDLLFSATGEMQAMLNDPYGKLMENIRSSLDEIESAQISIRVSDVMKDKAKRGEDHGGNLPYGHVRSNGKIEQVKDEIGVIHEIEDLYLAGYGVFSIAKWLNGHKVANLGFRPEGKAPKMKQHNRSSEEWTKDVIKTILFNPFYAGIIEYSPKGQRKLLKNKDLIIRAEGKHAPCRTIEKHQRIVRVRDNKISDQKSPRFYNTSFLLTGILNCAACGQKFISRNSTRTNGKQYSYYCCSSKASHIGAEPCKNHLYKKEILEEYVLQKIKERLNGVDFDSILNEIKNELESSDSNLDNQLKEIEKKIERINKDLKSLKRLLFDLEEDDQNYELLRGEYQEDQIGLLNDLNDFKKTKLDISEKMELNVDSNGNVGEIFEKMKNFSTVIDNAPFHLKKVLLDELVDDIEIDSETNVNIRFKFSLNKKYNKELTVGFEVINNSVLGDTTTSMNITFNLGIDKGKTDNFLQWADKVYNLVKDNFKKWLKEISVPFVKHFNPYQISKLTNIPVSTCREYFKGRLPSYENAKIISDTFNADLKTITKMEIAIQPNMIFEIVNFIERLKRNNYPVS